MFTTYKAGVIAADKTNTVHWQYMVQCEQPEDCGWVLMDDQYEYHWFDGSISPSFEDLSSVPRNSGISQLSTAHCMTFMHNYPTFTKYLC